ncbi:copper homeostasis membrane protein CopD [Flavisphingomonas formosensis]|uniref:copper homeostasis membrane protein CopD n=1 Tax=Flavisphingomonas formosensis TaxID=861534 RepID=UPI001E517157|nr:copper homeostasis membrane protein CopD [Sphingomonas formosensis]
MTEGVLIAARFALMLDLALLMGLPLFWWVMGLAGQRWVMIALALGGILMSALWLLASAASMTGSAMAPPDWTTAWILLTLTPIGLVLAVRGVALLVACMCAATHRPRMTLIPALIAAATLAWTGHAGATENMTGSLHRIADVAHVWAAAAWIGALAVLLHSLLTLRAGTADVRRVARMLTRFSAMGTMVVLTLAASGSINMIMIVGWEQLPALAASRYGMLLGIKLALFGLMLGLAAINRWTLTPALDGTTAGSAVGRLRLSLLIETGAATAIVALVAWFGTLDPSI